MRFLVDTNVISELRHPQGDIDVKRRFARLAAENVFVSVVVFGELSKGVALLTSGHRKRELRVWLSEFEDSFGDRILPLDRETARIWGTLTARCSNNGHSISVPDGQIAATALHHDLTLITRNVRDFRGTNLRIWNIWESDSPS